MDSVVLNPEFTLTVAGLAVLMVVSLSALSMYALTL